MTHRQANVLILLAFSIAAFCLSLPLQWADALAWPLVAAQLGGFFGAIVYGVFSALGGMVRRELERRRRPWWGPGLPRGES